MIGLRNVTKRLGDSFELSVPELNIEAKQAVALIGPSGCGKSTLLRIVMGLIEPDAGEVTVGGNRMTPEAAPALRTSIGYVIQEGALFPHLTAERNVTLVARLRGWDEERIAGRLDTLTGVVGLDRAMLRRYPLELSGGQRQRVGVMRALMLDPPVLVMDEPFGALDPQIRSQVQKEFGEILHRLQKTVLIVTHDMAEAVLLGDEIVLMRAGRIVQRGTVRELLDAPAETFVTEFIQAQRPPEELRS